MVWRTPRLSAVGGEVWFAFAAQRVHTRCDRYWDWWSVMHLYNVDGRTQLAENDDASSGHDSYLEWTCQTEHITYLCTR